VPWTATLFVVAPIAGALADRIGERPLLVGGLTLQAAGLGWVALIAEPGLGYAELAAPLIIAGVGASMAIPPAASSVVGAVTQDAVGKAAGANSMLRELGGVFGSRSWSPSSPARVATPPPRPSTTGSPPHSASPPACPRWARSPASACPAAGKQPRPLRSRSQRPRPRRAPTEFAPARARRAAISRKEVSIWD
jgi:hypothetical protein